MQDNKKQFFKKTFDISQRPTLFEGQIAEQHFEEEVFIRSIMQRWTAHMHQ